MLEQNESMKLQSPCNKKENKGLKCIYYSYKQESWRGDLGTTPMWCILGNQLPQPLLSQIAATAKSLKAQRKMLKQ